jgi:phospholipase C
MMTMIKRILWMTLCASFLLEACLPAQTAPTLPLPTSTAAPSNTVTPAITETALPTPTAPSLVPDFAHIAIIIFENKEFDTVINNRGMPYFNLLANTFTLLTQHFAVTHPSLPNYLSLIGGDTFGITDDCEFTDCYINSPSLPDLIEASGRTWKTYQDRMPDPCFTGNTLLYARKHNPFIFFDPIRLNEERCKKSIVPLTQMDLDIASANLPNFFFITPDICYSAHDCDISLADGWLKDTIAKVYPALQATNETFLIILTWDEGQGNHSCCGLPDSAGGRVATILVSPQVRANFQDATPYTHYSILKTISVAWGLPFLGHAADAGTTLITAPWK